MNFWQNHKVKEQGFEDTFFKIVVADNYTELLAPTSENEVDIFQYDSSKDALNKNESSFNVNELSFTINELSCISDIAKNCLSFCLEAKDNKKFRYVALFSAHSSVSITTISNLIYLGRIEAKVSGDDLVWSNSDYSKYINAKRDYKFSSIEFAVSILDECKIKDDTKNSLGVLTNGIRNRIIASDIFALEAFNDSVYHPLINLYDLIQLVLNKSQDLINDLTGEVINLVLTTSELGFKALPITQNTASDSDVTAIRTTNTLLPESTKNAYLMPQLSETDNDKSLYVSRALFNPEFIYPTIVDSDHPTPNESGIIERISSEQPYSISELENVSTFLFELARCFNCYLVKSYTIVSGNLTITFEFKPQSAIFDSTIIYPIGASEGSLDISNEIEEKGLEYYSTLNNQAKDGFDSLGDDLKPNSWQSTPTWWFKKLDEFRKTKKDKANIESKRLLLSTSYAIIQTKGVSGDASRPLTNKYYEYAFNHTANSERLSSAIFIPINLAIDTLSLRPIAQILWKFDTENKSGLLSEFVNFNLNTTRSYFLNTYSLTIPFYSAFAIKDSFGTITSVSDSNLKIGRIIRLNENFRIYNTLTSLWETANSDFDYTIIEIEKNLTSPEVKLKLQNKSRFAYGNYDGADITGEFSSGEGTGFLIALSDTNPIVTYEIDTSETILVGDVVVLFGTKIRKAKAIVEHYQRHFGIAKMAGVAGDFIPVDTSLIVQDSSFSFTTNDVLFVRTSTSLNISNSQLETITGAETMLYRLGVALNSNTLKINLLQGKLT